MIYRFVQFNLKIITPVFSNKYRRNQQINVSGWLGTNNYLFLSILITEILNANQVLFFLDDLIYSIIL